MKNNLKIGERTTNLTTEYCLLRYRQEMELKEFKNSLKILLSNEFNKTTNISRQKLEFIRTAYEKLINTRFSVDNSSNIRNTQEIAQYIYQNLIEYIDINNNSNSKDSYIFAYTNCKSEIINYYKTYFDNILRLKAFKEIQFQQLRILTKQLIEDETPVYIVSNIYKRLKSDLHIIKVDASEINYCREQYETLKEKLLTQIQEINKEFES